MRRQTRLAHPSFDATRLPKPLVECGCGDCPDAADPLADESEAWRDSLTASEVCPTPQPMTIERAAEAYLVYQLASRDSAERTSRFEAIRNQHGLLMDAERDLLTEWGDDVTTVLLSRRLSPIARELGPSSEGAGVDDYVPSHGKSVDEGLESDETDRRWIPPIKLDNRLHDSWRNVYDALKYHLQEFEWEYVAVTAPTESAATPHQHIYLWIRDPEDEVSVDHVCPAIDSHVRNTKGTRSEDHPVEAGESDAAVVQHDPPRVDANDERDLYIYRQRGEKAFRQNTAGFAYVMNQRPHWVLKQVLDGESDVGVGDVAVDGAAVAWASPNKWFSSSDGFGGGGGSGS